MLLPSMGLYNSPSRGIGQFLASVPTAALALASSAVLASVMLLPWMGLGDSPSWGIGEVLALAPAVVLPLAFSAVLALVSSSCLSSRWV
uniref:Uncharacterized protein n=1 Tax=Eutreptiella gymnastica TaxID=73025 RepID=A0A7S1NL79_9EUGL